MQTDIKGKKDPLMQPSMDSPSIDALGTPTRWYVNSIVTILLGLLLFYLLLYFVPLGSRPLAIPDETRYAEIPREMLATGNWVAPHLNGLRYFEKPPLGYWLNAASLKVFGENEFAVRFTSALAAGLTTLLVFLLARQLSKNRRVPIMAALIHMTFMEVYILGITSVLDNLVTLFLTAGIVAFFFATVRTERMASHRGLWWVSGMAFGLAFLSKGFLAFAVPVLVLVPWMLWQGRWRMLMTKSHWVVLAALFVALPWAILIHLHEGDFWRYFFWVEHIQRFSADNAQHKAPFYYFLMYLPALAFPWLSLAPAAISGLRGVTSEDEEKRNILRLLWLWLLLPFLFFSASSGKLATYILPCFPPLAVLISLGLTRYLDNSRGKLFDFGVLLNILIFLCLLVALWISQVINVGFRAYAGGEGVRVALLSFTLLLGTVAGLAAFLGNRTQWKLVASLAMIAPFLFSISFVFPNQVLEHKSPGLLLKQYQDRITEDTIIISDADLVRAAAWYFKRDDIYLLGQGELEYGLGYPDAAHRLLDQTRFASLVENGATHRPVLLLCHRACNSQFVALLPKTAQKHAWGEFTLWFTAAHGTPEPISKTGF